MNIMKSLLLFFATTTSAATATLEASTSNNDERNLQTGLPSLSCHTSLGTSATSEEILECCPEKSDDDAICTLIWCGNPDKMEVVDSCSCTDIERSCGQLTSYWMGRFLWPGELFDGCDAVVECCGGSETTNKEFNTCIAEKDIEVPEEHYNKIPDNMPWDWETATPSNSTTTNTTDAPSTEGGGGEEEIEEEVEAGIAFMMTDMSMSLPASGGLRNRG